MQYTAPCSLGNLEISKAQIKPKTEILEYAGKTCPVSSVNLTNQNRLTAVWHITLLVCHHQCRLLHWKALVIVLLPSTGLGVYNNCFDVFFIHHLPVCTIFNNSFTDGIIWEFLFSGTSGQKAPDVNKFLRHYTSNTDWFDWDKQECSKFLITSFSTKASRPTNMWNLKIIRISGLSVIELLECLVSSVSSVLFQTI